MEQMYLKSQNLKHFYNTHPHPQPLITGWICEATSSFSYLGTVSILVLSFGFKKSLLVVSDGK